MSPANFADRLRAAQQRTGSDRALLLRPRLSQMPLPIQRYDDPFLPFGKAIIDVTRHLVAAYAFDLASYLAIGAAGAVALERTIAYVGDDNLTMLHGWFAGPGYVAAAQAFGVDAVTLADESYVDTYRSAGLGVLDVDTPYLVGEGVRLRLFGDDVVYAGRGDDFADRIRAALESA